MKISHSIARIFFFLSAGLFVVAVVTAAFSLFFQLRSETVPAVVSGYVSSDRSIQFGIADDGGIHYFPVFVFTAENGEEYSFTARRGSLTPEYSEGESIQVRYLPDDPSSARIAETRELFGPSLAWSAVAVLFLLCALVFRFRFDEK